ncbi:hypothetical protein A7W90_18275 [Clostridium sp. Bc-iso-3]|nr:hypothetical protein A7W90_18275 [Clostridium sp. Bc-iso-3]
MPKTQTQIEYNNAIENFKAKQSVDVNAGVGNQKQILNVGAGQKPIPCAENIDINPMNSTVKFGDANNLSQYSNGQFDHIISNSPYKYNPLESDMLRVLKPDGKMTVTGNMNNKYFKSVYNATPQQLEALGLKIEYKGGIQDIFLKYGGTQSNGSPINNLSSMSQITLVKTK